MFFYNSMQIRLACENSIDRWAVAAAARNQKQAEEQ